MVFDSRHASTWRVALLSMSKGHDRDQIQEAALDRDVGDVGAPHLIGAIDREPVEKIGINPVLGMGFAGSRRLVDRLQAHEAHQPANAMTANADTVAAQPADHLT